MFRKAVWLIVVLLAFVGARFVLESVAANLLETATLMVEQGRYDAAEEKLRRIDNWFSWTDTGDKTAKLRETIDEKIASDRRSAEAERQRAAFEEAQAQWRAQEQADARQQQAESGEQPAGVHHGLNRAEKLKR